MRKNFLCRVGRGTCPYLWIIGWALAFLVRLVALGRYVTPDEPAWVHRSIQFSTALAAHDWAALPSTGHPGVTTMWLGSAGIAAQRWLSPTESAARLDWLRRMAWLAPENAAAFRRLAYFLSAGRVAVALVTTLGLAVLYPLTRRLFGRRAALLATGLLAFDPFLIGHSGLLHTDALLATFTLLALAAALNGLQEPRRPLWWSLAGLFSGLALLTKSPALLLFPFTLLIALIAHIPGRRALAGLWAMSNLLLSALLVVLALYPRLWVDPAGAVGDLFAFANRHIEGALRPIFFAGQMTYDPGPAFYPVVFLLRISPAALIGLLMSLPALPRLPAGERRAILLLIAFSVAFAALMSLGTKKHDRYILPALLPVMWVGGSRLGSRGLGSSLGYGLLLAMLLAIGYLPFARYPLSACNLLAGGPWVARRMIELDWGEKAGAAALRLNQYPDAAQLTVAAPSMPSFASLFKGRTVPLTQAILADYTVSGDPAGTDVATQRPYRIYTNTLPAEQAAYLNGHAGERDLILLDAATPLLRRYNGPAAILSAAAWPDYGALGNHISGAAAGRARVWLVTHPAAAPITTAQLRRTLAAFATPVFTATIGASAITLYTIQAVPTGSSVSEPAWMANFNQQIYLLDALLPAHPIHERLPVHLRWRADHPTPAALHASLYLRDAAGHAWAETGQPILNTNYFPTSAWAPGDWADGIWTLRPPATTPPGDYQVELTVTDENGAQFGAWDAGGRFLGTRPRVGNVRIAPPDTPIGEPPCAGTRLTAGALTTCLPPWTSHAIPSGDTLTLSLTWTASTPPEGDYQVRWRLTDAAEYLLPLSPYPTAHWRVGESFESRYDLRSDPALPAGTYTLTLDVLAQDGRSLWPSEGAGKGSYPYARVEILPRQRRFDLPTHIAHPLTLTLGQAIHLRGCDLPRTLAAPGDSLPLTLYWQADGPTDLSYTVFVHLVGPDGQNHGHVDYIPGGGAAPTTSWAAGQVIVDEITLPVAADAPAGAYRIAVGMYDAATGSRLPITDGRSRYPYLPLPDDRAFLPPEITIAGGAP